MNFDEFTNLITNSSEIFLTGIGFLAMIFTGIQAFLIYKTLEVAEKFESQHLKKLKIEEFFRNRKELFEATSNLQKSVNFLLSYTVDYSEVMFKSDAQLIYWKYDEEVPCPLYYFKKEQVVSIFYKRIKKEEESIERQISLLNSFLFLFDDKKLNSAFYSFQPLVLYWIELLKIKNDMNRPMFEAISREVERNSEFSLNEASKLHEVDFAVSFLKHINDYEKFDQIYSLENIISEIENFQREFYIYLKRLNN